MNMQFGGGFNLTMFLVLAGVIVGIAVIIYIIVWFNTLVVVPFNEVHVVSKTKKVNQYDGSGRYRYFKVLHGRTIIPKHVLDIEPPLIKLHDIDKLPFGVEISVKVQVTDPRKAAETLTAINHQTISKVVEDTVMSAARSVAMERNILDIMKEREEIESAIYGMVSDALNKLGLSPIIFDIKNIRDIDGMDVIASLERVKIAELKKNARVSEAIHNSAAITIEVEKRKENTVKDEQMKQEEENARLEREKSIADQMIQVEKRKLAIARQKAHEMAEIELEKQQMAARALRDKKMILAQAEADAIKLKAEADAEGIKLRGEAEAATIKHKAEAMNEYNNVSAAGAKIKMAEILSAAQVEMAEKLATALGSNNKIMYLPMDGKSSFIGNFLPKLDMLLQSDVVQRMLSKLSGKGDSPE
ncbi:hypothetical protein GF325_14110 [Candidatus Bathyarchaeota archaeon]|nr:hypothetical protein [Candidatus Bathyarchaeota archaeon]